MQKDVIYIDTEDDITAIIGKVKNAKEKIVALVPPKRVGAIQSAVNLKLVHRTAEQADKRLVIISSNPALVALASATGIPTAKNLQSRPEMAEIPALEVDDGEDIIDGSVVADDKGAASSSAVSAPAASAAGKPSTSIDEAITAVESESNPPAGEKSDSASALGAAAVSAGSTGKKRSATGKVPNFNRFRKKFILIILGVLLLVGFLVWAFAIAPKATIVITAETSEVALNTPVTLDPSVQTSLPEGTIKTELKTVKKDVSIPITPTGQKDVGEKAKGTVRFTVSSLDAYVDGVTVPAGTRLASAGGSTFTTDAAVVFQPNDSARDWRNGQRPSKSVSVTATASGASYNGASGPASGAPSGVSASFSTPTSGGTDKKVTVVSQGDVNAAAETLSKQLNAEEEQKALQETFGKDYLIIEASFKADTSGVNPQPGIDQEVSDGRAALAGSITYSLMAAPKKEVTAFLDKYFAQQIDGRSDQRVYNNGYDEASLEGVAEADGKYTATLTATGEIGPKINEQAIKEYARGKKYGEIKAKIEEIDGVDTVDVKFSPFWVTSAPGDVKKINFEFKVRDAR